MNKYKFFISLVIALSCAACSSDMKITRKTHFLNPNVVGENIRIFPKSINNMKECGRGYVVGIWSNGNGWNEWAVWLSKKGRSWSNNDAQIYWAYSKLNTDYDSGKNAYATILAAQASGQMVELLDDDMGFRCDAWGTGIYRGPQFDSVQAWFP
ncbi:hypothetical protein [Xenorhabdus kozodoii]|uniref:Uncharacterized protein n=1 Tax=Xenorhabdus kozodoii TaxID=351676 RepID=A0A2D0LCX2_9GAMM|nr:hypothetical protein [Xenorhabdus kozodoii]PHM73500.1 hypothetical protein Xkoz_01916 [Xenorhabdus kozodoii]